MQHFHKAFSLIGGLALAVGIAAPTYSQVVSKPQVLGVVDRDRVVISYSRAAQAANELKQSEEKVHKLLEYSNQQYEAAKKAHKAPAELQGLERRLRAQIEGEVKRVESRAQVLESQLQADIDTAIKNEAASRKIDLVMLRSAVPMGGTDITPGVIKRLSVLAAAGPKQSVAK